MQYAEDLERLLVRMTEKVERASQMHASRSHLSGEDWSELAMLAKEARAQLDQAAN
ncbi:hypothetical protein ACFOFO_16170 [Undibacterium arcticum]|uniref:Uncharacterized protein n=2 Tax=Undibacterium arcticum TaxID=1762892 RepID=A0ABV7F331_9BURK